jgi:hypothetical protein
MGPPSIKFHENFILNIDSTQNKIRRTKIKSEELKSDRLLTCTYFKKSNSKQQRLFIKSKSLFLFYYFTFS